MSKINKLVKVIIHDLKTNTDWSTDASPVWYYYNHKLKVRITKRTYNILVRGLQFDDVEVPLTILQRLRLAIALKKHKILKKKVQRREQKKRIEEKLHTSRLALDRALEHFTYED